MSNRSRSGGRNHGARGRDGNAARDDRPARSVYYFQVHFAAHPGVRRNHLDDLQDGLREHLRAMIERGQLLAAGGYPSSLGGMWLLRVKSHAEADRLVRSHPAVEKELLTFRLVELEEPLGLVVAAAPAARPAETVEMPA